MTSPATLATRAPQLAGSLHPNSVVDRITDSTDIVRLAFRARQIDGSEPHVRQCVIDGAHAPLQVLPKEAIVERSATSDSSIIALARCSTSSVLVNVLARSTVIAVSAAEPALADELLERMHGREGLRERREQPRVRVWHLGCNDRPTPQDRLLDLPRWDEIAVNYPREVRRSLDGLVAVERPDGIGKLILWHGEPGTGKTTALRALANAWAPWCTMQYITDPERFFSHPGYISEVISRAANPPLRPTLDDPGQPESLWRLIVAEDTDEYLRSSARRDAGAGLGRLLNLTDGLLGQGFNTLVLITTNEELSRLHPAITRPGRCLARVEFNRFSISEAASWLPADSATPQGPMTLAELLEARGDLQGLTPQIAGAEPTGLYL